MDAIKISVAWVEVNTTFVGLLQVMANMHKGCASESVTKMSLSAICCDKSCEPIISQANGWNLASIAAVLQACLSETRDHLSGKNRSIIRIWAWEDI
jgi:hypothetical protein